MLRKGSKMFLNIYYTITDENGTTSLPKRIKYLESTYSIDHLETEWYGYNSEGTYQNTSYKMKWRYYAFVVKPSKKVIKADLQDKDYLAIANAYNAGNKITIYAYPSFVLNYKGENEYKVARGLRNTNFIPYNNIKSDSGIAPPKPLNTELTKVNFGTNLNDPSSFIEFNNNLGTITYGYNNVGFDEGTYSFKSTTITNDGVVMRAGKYVFGLGYSRNFISHRGDTNKTTNSGQQYVNNYVTVGETVGNTTPAFNTNVGIAEDEPVLFYHEYDPTYYKIDTDENGNKVQTNKPASNVKTDLTGYAQRTHTIPLKDIFNVIKYIRATVPLETLKLYDLVE
jgi:hypothetical protein